MVSCDYSTPSKPFDHEAVVNNNRNLLEQLNMNNQSQSYVAKLETTNLHCLFDNWGFSGIDVFAYMELERCDLQMLKWGEQLRTTLRMT